MEIDEKIPQILISDRRKIQRILLNLLGNAIKFTKSGHITVKIKYLEQSNDFIKLQFSVSDTGIGIPQELHHKVFERFYRSTPAYKGMYKGHGLGLHIVKTYVQLLGGQITLISKEGAGSTFQFELQCQTPKDAHLFSLKPDKVKEEPRPIMHLDPNNSSLPLCLLIEDNPTALIVLESLISQTGCTYLSAKNAEEALNIIKKTQVDLIITDIGLPGISGIEFSSLTRQWEKENHQTKRPIIGLTGHAREAAYNECIASGMDNVYTKPANGELINTIISTYINNASLDKIDQASLSIFETGLPATESELFQLEQFVLLDREEGIRSCGGDKALFEKMLHLMVSQEIPADLEQMKLAFAKQEFETVEKLAHKIKGGGVYLGLIRLKYACQYVERYWKSGERALFEPLYNQAIMVIETTCQDIKF